MDCQLSTFFGETAIFQWTDEGRPWRRFLPAWRSLGAAHAARTALAAALSLAVARSFAMAEDYWAPITALVVVQSTFGEAWNTAKQRLFGTAIGVSFGALLAGELGPSIAVFGTAIFLLGPFCALLRLDRSAYRFAGIALAIVLLIARVQSPWITGLHRFWEVSIGIVVALVVTAAWPLREAPAGGAKRAAPDSAEPARAPRPSHTITP